MPTYTNEYCPVCHKKFEEDDDIVICPQCGTPHHRECYNFLGHCVNEKMHGDGFSYTPASEPKDAEEKSADGSGALEKKRCIRCGENIEKNAQFCSHCGQRQPMDGTAQNQSPFGFDGGMFTMPKSEFENDGRTVEGKKISDIANVVGSNARRFITKFIENRKISWNWGALFFGPYYLFFRKMYKEGIITMAIRLIISLVAQGIYAEEFAALSRFVNSNYSAISSGNISDELLNKANELSLELMPMLAIMLVGNAVLHIIIALFADGFYRSRVLTVLKKVDEKLDAGEMFEQSFMFGADNVTLSQEDMKRLYLSKIGGTSLFNPLIAFFVYDLVTSIISSL